MEKLDGSVGEKYVGEPVADGGTVDSERLGPGAVVGEVEVAVPEVAAVGAAEGAAPEPAVSVVQPAVDVTAATATTRAGAIDGCRRRAERPAPRSPDMAPCNHEVVCDVAGCRMSSPCAPPDQRRPGSGARALR
jgi:hypothetical protein